MSETSFSRRRKILVVDDQEDLLELLRQEFKDQGFAIATAKDGVEAIKKARTLVPDVILLDARLPELDGFAVCEILRRDTTTASIPIIMLTGLTSQFSRCAAIESGATDFITKPATQAELVSRVRNVLAQSSTAATTATP